MKWIRFRFQSEALHLLSDTDATVERRSRSLTIWAAVTALLALSCATSTVRAQETQTPQRDLTDVPMEKLMDIEVYTPSKKEEKLSATPAAISVITQDDIRRSGAKSIPEALRLVPGLDVAQLDSQDWAISARGFNDQFANKLLVLQDGRSVSHPCSGSSGAAGAFMLIPGMLSMSCC